MVTQPCHVIIWYAFFLKAHMFVGIYMLYSPNLTIHFHCFKHKFISFEVNSVIKSWHKWTTKIFEWHMGTHLLDSSRITLDLCFRMVRLLFQLLWSVRTHHSKSGFSLICFRTKCGFAMLSAITSQQYM